MSNTNTKIIAGKNTKTKQNKTGDKTVQLSQIISGVEYICSCS